MKKIMLALVMAAAVAICTGFIGGPKYDVSYQAVKIGSGDTLWAVADMYYLEAKAGNMCFEEYLHELIHTPANEKLTANGRMLQPGDTVMVPVFRAK